MTEQLINLQNLTIKDPHQHVLVDQVSLELQEREFVGIVGESGSGKTITVQSILDIVSKDVLVSYQENMILGKNMGKLNKKEKRQLIGSGVGFVPQNTMAFLHPLLKIKNQIGDSFRVFTGARKAEANEKAESLLGKVGIKDPKQVLNSYPVELSGGMKQRVNIAMALMTDPKIIIADEPTTALDTVVQRQVMELFERLHREDGVSVLFISHDLKIVQKYCQRMYVMYKGHVVESGTTSDIFVNPNHSYTKQLLSFIPTLTEEKMVRLG